MIFRIDCSTQTEQFSAVATALSPVPFTNRFKQSVVIKNLGKKISCERVKCEVLLAVEQLKLGQHDMIELWFSFESLIDLERVCRQLEKLGLEPIVVNYTLYQERNVGHSPGEEEDQRVLARISSEMKFIRTPNGNVYHSRHNYWGASFIQKVFRCFVIDFPSWLIDSSSCGIVYIHSLARTGCCFSGLLFQWQVSYATSCLVTVNI